MKKTRMLAILLSAVLFVAAFPFSALDAAAATSPEITSGNALAAYCVDDGQFLYCTRREEKVSPTVATKLITAMVVYDLFSEKNHSLTETAITVTAESLQSIGAVGDLSAPMMGLSAGSAYSAQDLLSATLVANANDACSVLAHYCGDTYLGGGVSSFVARMNRKAGEIGLTNTRFVNATGVDNVTQVSTVAEVALIAAAFYKYDYLVKLSNVESFLFNGKATVRNKNYLHTNFFINGYLNKNAVGMIAGQKDSKGDYCLITATEKEGRAYVFVVMCATGMRVDAEGNRWFEAGNAYDDMKELLDWTRSSFTYKEITAQSRIIDELHVNLGNADDHVKIVPSETVEKLVNSDVDVEALEKTIVYDESTVYKSEVNGETVNTIDAPVTRGQRVGSITYSFNGIEIATVDLVVRDSIDSSGMLTTLDGIKGFLLGDTMMTVLKILGALLAVYILYAVTMAIIRAVKGKRRGKRKPGKKDLKKPDENATTKHA